MQDLTRVSVKVRLAVLLVVLVSPEANRHRRMWPRAHQLTGCATILDALSIVVKDIHSHTEYFALKFWKQMNVRDVIREVGGNEPPA